MQAKVTPPGAPDLHHVVPAARDEAAIPECQILRTINPNRTPKYVAAPVVACGSVRLLDHVQLEQRARVLQIDLAIRAPGHECAPARHL